MHERDDIIIIVSRDENLKLIIARDAHISLRLP